MKSAKTNLLLALILACLGGFAYWYVSIDKPAAEKKETASRKLFAVESDAVVKSLEIHFKDKSTDAQMQADCLENCTLSNPNANWQLKSPLVFKADAGNISGFINSISMSAVAENLSIQNESELDKYGLSKEKRDQHFIEMNVRNQTIKVSIGDDAPIEDNLYVYVETQGKPARLVMVPSNIKNLIKHDVGYWRSKKMFAFAQSQIESIKLENKNGKVELYKKDMNWFVRGKEIADQQLVDTFLTGIVYLNAIGYLSDDKKTDRVKYKFPTKPRAKINIAVAPAKGTQQASQDIELEIYDVNMKKGSVKTFGIFKDKDYIVELDHLASNKFDKKPHDFWNHTLLSSEERARVRTIKASLFGKDEHERRELVFKFDDQNHWILATPDPMIKILDEDRVRLTLDRLEQLKVAEYYPNHVYPKSGTIELSRWTLLDEHGNVLRSLQLYGDPLRKGDFFVKILNSPYNGEIGKADKAAALGIPINILGFQKLATETPKN